MTKNIFPPEPDIAKRLFQRAINNKDAIKQKREYIKDIIHCAEPNSSTLLVFYCPADLILMQKGFTPSLKRKAVAKNFTLEFTFFKSITNENITNPIESPENDA
ncbi:hypothetical protein [Nostoc sp.]|uniref:hypothetical protein n=1 Tax=Nostoc sp. TaxID=1180 RepID=UPI002FF4BE06